MSANKNDVFSEPPVTESMTGASGLDPADKSAELE